MKFLLSFLFVLSAIFIAGCAVAPPTGSINDSAKSAIGPNVVPLGKYSTKTLLYEKQALGGVEVSYNLFQGYILQNQLYWLTLIVKNTGDSPIDVVPTVELRDSLGIEIPAHTYSGFMSMAASVASGAPVVIPTATASSQTYRTTQSGTITSASGNTYYYSGASTTSSGANSFAGGLAQGMAQGAALGNAMRAREMRQISPLLMSWADSYWLRNSYTIKPGNSVVGTLTFPAPRTLPLVLEVSVGGNKVVRFTTGKELIKHD